MTNNPNNPDNLYDDAGTRLLGKRLRQAAEDSAHRGGPGAGGDPGRRPEAGRRIRLRRRLALGGAAVAAAVLLPAAFGALPLPLPLPLPLGGRHRPHRPGNL